MKEYKIEDGLLWEEFNDSIDIQKWRKPFQYGMDFTREEKIKFLDENIPKIIGDKRYHDNVVTYILNLHDKYQKEKDTLPQMKSGGINTNSLKAWLRKNDTRGFHDAYHVGELYFLWSTHYLGKTTMYSEVYNKTVDIVDYWFQKFLYRLANIEKNYLNDNNPIAFKIRRVEKFCQKYGYLNNIRVSSIGHNGLKYLEKSWMDWTKYKPVTEPELDNIILTYEKLEKFYYSLSAELTSVDNNFDEFSPIGKKREEK